APAPASLALRAEPSPCGYLLQGIRDLVLKVAGRMIPAELAQRRFVQLLQDVAQLLGCGIAGGKALSVNLAQRTDQGVAVLVADFAVMVAVAIVETWLAHAVLHRACGRQHPPAGPKGQPMTGAGRTEVAIRGRNRYPVLTYFRQLCASLNPSTSRAFRFDSGASCSPSSRLIGTPGQ